MFSELLDDIFSPIYNEQEFKYIFIKYVINQENEETLKYLLDLFANYHVAMENMTNVSERFRWRITSAIIILIDKLKQRNVSFVLSIAAKVKMYDYFLELGEYKMLKKILGR